MEQMIQSKLRIQMANQNIKTLRELGRRANISWKVLSNLDNNENIDTIQIGNLLKVCYALRCRIEDLIDVPYPY